MNALAFPLSQSSHQSILLKTESSLSIDLDPPLLDLPPQLGPQNHLVAPYPSKSKPPLKWKGRWSHSGARKYGTQLGRIARHRRTHSRAGHPSEGRMGALLILPVHTQEAPPLWSRSSSIQKPSSACIGCRGLSLMRVVAHTSIRGPTLAPFIQIRTSILRR
jgi:hypothetical protein